MGSRRTEDIRKEETGRIDAGEFGACGEGETGNVLASRGVGCGAILFLRCAVSDYGGDRYVARKIFEN